MADCQAVLDIRNDLAATMDECREVDRTVQYRTQRVFAPGTAVYEVICGTIITLLFTPLTVT